MNFIKVGHRAIAFGDVANLGNRRDVAVHGVDALERNDLRAIGVDVRELTLQIGRRIVLPDALFTTGMADSLDHAGMIERIREDDRVGKTRAECAERGPVRHVTAGEKKRGFLAVKIGQLLLQQHVFVHGTGDVTRTAGTRAVPLQSVVHRLQHRRVLAHAKIVVGTPDRHIGRLATRVALGSREGALATPEFGKNPIVALSTQSFDLSGEERIIVHRAVLRCVYRT